MVFVSGQLPIDAATGQMAEGIEGQARQSLENIKTHFLKEAGLTMGNIVKNHSISSGYVPVCRDEWRVCHVF